MDNYVWNMRKHATTGICLIIKKQNLKIMITEVQQHQHITEKLIDNMPALWFTFNENLDAHTAKKMCEQWKKLSDRYIEPVLIIFDARKMKDYDPMSRIHFQKCMTEQKANISKIWVVTNSAKVKAGASILGMFTSFTIKTVSDPDQIKV